jgi:hypothetical protein
MLLNQQECELLFVRIKSYSALHYVGIYSLMLFYSVSVNHGQIPQASSSKPICGIVGTLQLLAGPYLVVITKKSKVGTINGQTIWKVAETEVISYTRTLLHLTEKQVR